MSAPAAAIIRSCRCRCRSRPRPGADCWCAPGPQADAVRGASGRLAHRYLPALRRLVGSRHLPDRSRNGTCWARAASSSAPTSSSIGRMPATTRSTRFLAALASRKRKTIRREREDALSAGISVHWLTGAGPHRERVGRVLRLLHGNRLAQVGAPLSHAAVLFDGRREDARPHPAGDGQAQRALDRRRHQFHRVAIRCSAATGAQSNITRSCISSSATTRPSSTPSSTSLRASRPAPRASTRFRAATCRRRPIPRTTSSIPALRRAIEDFLKHERAYVAAAGAELADTAPFRKE